MAMLYQWIDKDAPLYSRAFRVFFLLSSGYAILLIFSWMLLMTEGTLFYAKMLNWYIHEFLFGVCLATLSGFLLAAFPIWTKTERISFSKLILLAVIWIFSRMSVWLHLYIGITPAVIFNCLFLVLLLRQLLPAVLLHKNAKHRIFCIQILCLFLLQIMTYRVWYTVAETQVNELLNIIIGIFIILTITSLSRVSMVVATLALEKYDLLTVRYYARPPRRNFAISIMTLYLLVHFFMPNSSISGWLALACTASILNILNDWLLPKIGKDIYVQAFYVFYLSIALVFLLIGINNIWSVFPDLSFSLHALMGSLGLAVLIILLVVGQRHTGRSLSYRWHIKLMILAMMIAAVLSLIHLKLSLLFCLFSFFVYFINFKSKLIQPRIENN